MDKLTKEQAIIISGYTNYLICNFQDFHHEVEKRLGRPVWTNEFPYIEEEVRQAFREDFLALAPDEDKQ